MTPDEKAIRNLIDLWLSASKANDTATVLTLMADDVVFQTVGREPFGKKEFVAQSAARPKNTTLDIEHQIVEIRVLGDFALLRNKLRVSITPENAKPLILSGYTLTFLEKNSAGHWQITRDANLLIPEK